MNGIRCGACKGRHDKARDVAACYAELRDYEAQAEQDQANAEYAAEMAHERWLEDAGSRMDPAGYEHDRMMEMFDPQLNGEWKS